MKTLNSNTAKSSKNKRKDKISYVALRQNYYDNLCPLFDASQDFFFILDLKGQILYINQAAQKTLKYPAEELIGLSLIKLHPANHKKRLETILSETLKVKTAQYRIPLIAKDKTLIPVETKVIRGIWSNKEVILVAPFNNNNKFKNH